MPWTRDRGARKKERNVVWDALRTCKENAQEALKRRAVVTGERSQVQGGGENMRVPSEKRVSPTNHSTRLPEKGVRQLAPRKTEGVGPQAVCDSCKLSA